MCPSFRHSDLLFLPAQDPVYQHRGPSPQRLRVIYSNYLANDAHVVTVDPATGRSYFPVLSASGGHPALLVCELT